MIYGIDILVGTIKRVLKMNDTKFVVHDRVGIKGEYVPVDGGSFLDIPEIYKDNLKDIERYSEELHNARNELGRLMQVMYSDSLKDNLPELGRLVQITHHLVLVCNTAENNLAQAKTDIINGMSLGEGNWVIDFSKVPAQVGRVLPTDKKIPRVV